MVRDAYNILDKTYDGKVTLEDIELSYRSEFHPLVLKGELSAPEVLRDFLRQWNKVDDEVSYDEFLEYHKNLSAMVPSDSFFSELMSGVWGIEDNLVNVSSSISNSVSNSIADENEDVNTIESSYQTSSNQTASIADMKKASVPDWLKFDKMFFCFSLYHNEQVVSHEGSFNPKSRAFETNQNKSFRVRQFTLKYAMHDKSIQVTEITPGERFTAFIAKSFIPEIKLESLVVGKQVTLRGLKMMVYDADKSARAYLKDQLNTYCPKGALPLPETKEEEVLKCKIDTKKPSKRSTIDKVLQFDCSWDDPSPYGQMRFFKMYFYLSDDTMELKEINLRNSGRERTSLLNIKRQCLENPVIANQIYTKEDLKVGSFIQVFGRMLRINDTTTDHSDPNEQNISQMIQAIKSSVEQKSNYAPLFDQQKLLFTILRRHLEDPVRKPDILSQAAFEKAMSSFSCFGSEVQMLFSKFANEDHIMLLSEFLKNIYEETTIHQTKEISVERLKLNEDNKSKVNGLKQALIKKMEAITNFGDIHQQERAFKKHLLVYCVRPSTDISKRQFKNALIPLNYWEKDAELLFDCIGGGKGVSCDHCVDFVFKTF